MEAQTLLAEQPFFAAHEAFLELTSALQSPEAMEMHLSSLEELVEDKGREVMRRALEEHIKLRGLGDVGLSVVGADEVERTHKRERSISQKTIFGEVDVDRQVYSKPGVDSLAPKDAMLNLPENSYSHELSKRLAREVAKSSFSEAIDAVKAQTSVAIPRRQAEEITLSAAKDFEAFYEERSVAELRRVTKSKEILVLSTDGKGIVMREDDLREATKKKAQKSKKKLKKRLSKGEKKNAKRMAQVATVYSIDQYERTVEDILLGRSSKNAPKPEGKRVWASVETDAKDVVSAMFDEASRRDPRRKREWAILVDGQPYQLGLIDNELSSRKIAATVILDIIHVIEYLWKASRDFHAEGTSEGEEWVNHYLEMVLAGKAKLAAAAMRRSATRQGLASTEGVESCAVYLHNNAAYMDYADYLARGLPIATGVIEGACRHLVKDRMDVTGARWSLEGAEAVLKLRSIYASGDWQEYWAFHEIKEYERNHAARYAMPQRLEKPRLRIAK